MFGVHYGFSYHSSSLLIREQAAILAPSQRLLAGLALQAWCGHHTHLHGCSTGGVSDICVLAGTPVSPPVLLPIDNHFKNSC